MEGIKKKKRYSDESVIEMLISTYPDSITVEEGRVCFDETCETMAQSIMENFDTGRQKYYFAREFEGYNDCLYYLRNTLSRLWEKCQEFVDNHSDHYE